MIKSGYYVCMETYTLFVVYSDTLADIVFPNGKIINAINFKFNLLQTDIYIGDL